MAGTPILTGATGNDPAARPQPAPEGAALESVAPASAAPAAAPVAPAAARMAPADSGRQLRCPLCGRDFPADAMDCHAGCPLSRHCTVLCCPHCGYEFPDEEATRRRVERVRNLFRAVLRKPR